MFRLFLVQNVKIRVDIFSSFYQYDYANLLSTFLLLHYFLKRVLVFAFQLPPIFPNNYSTNNIFYYSQVAQYISNFNYPLGVKFSELLLHPTLSNNAFPCFPLLLY